MKRYLIAMAVAALASGCGSDTGPVADDPAPTAVTETPAPTLKPAWPEQGCDVRSASSIDYAADAEGPAKPEEAVAGYAEDGLTVVPPRQGNVGRWLLVDADNRIVKVVSVFDGGHGWLVEGVEECSG